MTLNPIIEKFYLEALDYSGLIFEDNIIKNKSKEIGNITIDGKHITLPYFNNLKNPDGKIVFHLLNENYTNPENVVFDFYKKRLVLELNIKLSYLIVNIISVSADVQLQQKIKSSKLINIISNVGEADHVLTENFLNVIKASKKVNSEAFLFDIYLKKNGEINDTPYAAIGKINFILANEVAKALEEKDREYKVFGYKLRKKDLLALNNIFNIIFNDYGNEKKYIEGTDNKVFRYLNILLKTSYMISFRMNEICDILDELKEPALNIDECRSNLNWVKYLEDLQSMATEIRMIPSQIDISSEAHRLKLDETKASITKNQEFNPANIPQQQQVVQPFQQVAQQHSQQVALQQPAQLSPEDIIKSSINNMQPIPMQQPIMPMQQPQIFTPNWVVQESIKNNLSMNPVMQQPMMPMQQPFMQQPFMQQPIMPMNMNPNMTTIEQSGIAFNPMFQNRTSFR